MMKCSACGKFLFPADAAKCYKCTLTYHRSCVALPCRGSITQSWCCPECKSKLPRDNKAETLVKGIFMTDLTESPKPVEKESSSPQMVTNKSIQHAESDGSLLSELRLFRDEINAIRNDFLEELRATRLEFQAFRSEMTQIQSTITLCNEKLNKLDTRVDILEKRFTETNISQLEATVAQLKKDINDRDQELLINDLEIANLPEETGENLSQIISLIAIKLQVDLSERDVISVSRAGGQLRADNAEGPGHVRPRPVIVKLARTSLKNELLRNARVRRGATTVDLGLNSKPRRFYVNERLTKYNRLLFHKVREAGRLCSWKFIWTKRGRIFARRDHNSDVIQITCETDITKICELLSGKQ